MGLTVLEVASDVTSDLLENSTMTNKSFESFRSATVSAARGKLVQKIVPAIGDATAASRYIPKIEIDQIAKGAGLIFGLN